MKRFLAIIHARNLECVRDRAALIWNLLFPGLLVIGFAVAFSGSDRVLYKIGTLHASRADDAGQSFLATRHLEFVAYDNPEQALDRVRRHQVAVLVDFAAPARYWVNPDSPEGYVSERLLRAAGADYLRSEVRGRPIRYVDWVLPGILGMNMMFSALFGVGYVIVRYRKNGVLKRLHATPLTAFEFLCAQVVSRLLILMLTSMLLFTGCRLMINFPMRGSYLELFLLALAGGFCLITLGLLVAARTSSEEWAGGMLNFFTWPMMFLSGVWFSLEGTPEWMQMAAWALPLTHLVAGARQIMIDGESLLGVAVHFGVLVTMSLVFLAIGARTFRWND